MQSKQEREWKSICYNHQPRTSIVKPRNKKLQFGGSTLRD